MSGCIINCELLLAKEYIQGIKSKKYQDNQNLRNTRKSTQMENFTSSNIFYEKVGNIAVLVVDFIRTYCVAF